MADDAFKRRLESFETAHKAAEAVDTNKLNFYTAGQQKKSKREREKEAAEAKRLQEEEDAARAYKDFVASFDDPASTGDHGGRGLKTFVRAGGSGSPSAPQSFGHPSPASSSGYRPGPSTASRPTSNPLAPRDATHAPPAAGPTHRPAFKQPSQKTGAALFADDDGPAVPAPAAPGKKRRAMDHFLEELKRDQDTREKRLQQQVAQGVATSVSAAAAQDLARSQGPSAGGSFDTGDPRTTNLHVGNLPANVTANALGMHFAQYGPVASVKIMWPREQGGANIGMMQNSAAFAATRAGLNGFIAFMKRDDAQRALDKMDGVEWGGAILQLGWGKAMPLPPRPIYVADTPYQRSGRSRSPSPKRSRRESRSPDYHDSDRRDRGRPSKRSRRSRSDSRSDRSRSRSPDRSRGGRRSRSRSRSRNRSPDHRKGYSDRRAGSRSRSRSPRERRWPKLDSRELQGRLEDVAEKIRQYGKRYEDTLRDKERNNPSYDFLRNNALPAFHYFKMLLDNRYRAPSPPPPPFVDEGDTQVQSSDESDIEREMKDKKRNNLGRLSRAKLEAMLRTITSTRERIGQVMCFALDRPDAADEVSDVLIQSLLISSTPVPRKFARLCVISDILHNCAGTPTNAWKYRSLFESKLPQVFTHLGEIYKSFPGRMKAEIFRKQIMTIVNVWEHWLVFNPSVLADLATRLSTGDTAAQTESEANGDVEARSHSAKAVESSRKPLAGFAAVKSGSTGPEVHHDQDEDLDGQAIDDSATANQDLDGEPLDGDDIDGAPV